MVLVIRQVEAILAIFLSLGCFAMHVVYTIGEAAVLGNNDFQFIFPCSIEDSHIRRSRTLMLYHYITV